MEVEGEFRLFVTHGVRLGRVALSLLSTIVPIGMRMELASTLGLNAASSPHKIYYKIGLGIDIVGLQKHPS